MDWNDTYQKVSTLVGINPYGCSENNCNHVAKGTFGLMFHHYFGTHHLNHPTR